MLRNWIAVLKKMSFLWEWNRESNCFFILKLSKDSVAMLEFRSGIKAQFCGNENEFFQNFRVYQWTRICIQSARTHPTASFDWNFPRTLFFLKIFTKGCNDPGVVNNLMNLVYFLVAKSAYNKIFRLINILGKTGFYSWSNYWDK